MAKMEEAVKDIFSNVNEWLKFAEAKNAAIIAFHLGSTFGAATIITQSEPNTVPEVMLNYIYWFITLNSIGLFFALFSFWPQMRIEDVLREKIEDIFCFKRSAIEENLLFYGYINNCGRDLYLSKLCGSCNKEITECSKLELNYVTQIVTNSRIAVRKYFYFKVALLSTTIALLSPILLPVIFLYNIANCLIMKQYKKSLIHLIMFILSSLIAWKVIWKYVIV
mgnify:CR=1 FL=1